MNKLFLYNTLSGEKEEFKEVKRGEVRIYTCGPTVYNYAHIGNLRAYIFADILVRAMRYNYGEENVKWVMNITDVDDKTIRDSKIEYPKLEPMAALKQFTSKYEKLFWEDIDELNINRPDIAPHAAGDKYVEAQQKLVINIFNAGYAYIKDGSVYFDVVKYSKKYKYGQLVDINVSKLKSGARVDSDEYEKENVQDFVLWKGRKEGEPSWPLEINGEKLPGRPGWHIECSAMGESELGMPFDIHTGGVDLKFPHHENEIHQSVIGYGCEKPVNYWLHNEFLLVDGAKMSKRYNNFYTLRDLEKKDFKSLAFRFLCMQTHYGKQMNFTFESLKSAEEGLSHLYNQAREFGTETGSIDKNFKNKFIAAVSDDFNTPQALAVIQELLKSDISNKNKLATVLDFDKVLGLNISGVFTAADLSVEVADLVKVRDKARVEKKFDESDRLRAKIEKMGYIVEDTKDGQRIYKK